MQVNLYRPQMPFEKLRTAGYVTAPNKLGFVREKPALAGVVL
jgi:hypothetical protein